MQKKKRLGLARLDRGRSGEALSVVQLLVLTIEPNKIIGQTPIFPPPVQPHEYQLRSGTAAGRRICKSRSTADIFSLVIIGQFDTADNLTPDNLTPQNITRIAKLPYSKSEL